MAVVFVVMSAVGGLSIQTGYAEDTITTINAIVPNDISQGDTFDVELDIANATDLYGFSIGLYYDSTLLELVSPDGVGGTTAVTPGNVFTGQTMDDNNLVNGFEVNNVEGWGAVEFANCLIGSTLGVDVDSEGASLGKITFKALQAGNMAAIFDTDPYSTPKTMPAEGSHVLVKLSDSNAAAINYQASDLHFTVDGDAVQPSVQIFGINDVAEVLTDTTWAAPSFDIAMEAVGYESPLTELIAFIYNETTDEETSTILIQDPNDLTKQLIQVPAGLRVGEYEVCVQEISTGDEVDWCEFEVINNDHPVFYELEPQLMPLGVISLHLGLEGSLVHQLVDPVVELVSGNMVVATTDVAEGNVDIDDLDFLEAELQAVSVTGIPAGTYTVRIYDTASNTTVEILPAVQSIEFTSDPFVFGDVRPWAITPSGSGFTIDMEGENLGQLQTDQTLSVRIVDNDTETTVLTAETVTIVTDTTGNDDWKWIHAEFGTYNIDPDYYDIEIDSTIPVRNQDYLGIDVTDEPVVIKGGIFGNEAEGYYLEFKGINFNQFSAADIKMTLESDDTGISQQYFNPMIVDDETIQYYFTAAEAAALVQDWYEAWLEVDVTGYGDYKWIEEDVEFRFGDEQVNGPAPLAFDPAYVEEGYAAVSPLFLTDNSPQQDAWAAGDTLDVRVMMPNPVPNTPPVTEVPGFDIVAITVNDDTIEIDLPAGLQLGEYIIEVTEYDNVKLEDIVIAAGLFEVKDDIAVEGYQVDGTVSVNMVNDTSDGIDVALYHYDEASGKYVIDSAVLDTTNTTGAFSVMIPQSGDYQLGFYKSGYLLNIEPITISDADVALPNVIELVRGDVNNDQAIDFYDITNVISKYNILSTEAEYDLDYDVDMSGQVEFYDITNIIAVYDMTTHHEEAAEFMVISIE